MPPVRDHTPPDGDSDAPSGKGYSSRLAELRGELRKKMNKGIYIATNGKVKRMKWTRLGYALHIVGRGQKRLQGWPLREEIPFANLSDLGGGQETMEYLLLLWDVGILRFEDATEDEVYFARRGRVELPGYAPRLPKPRCWGPFGSEVIGRTRDGTRKKQKTGPKTPRIVPGSD